MNNVARLLVHRFATVITVFLTLVFLYPMYTSLSSITMDLQEKSSVTQQIVKDIYQIWQHTVLNTLLASHSLWIDKEDITTQDQRDFKEKLKLARYKIHFICHHMVGNMITNARWAERRTDLVDLCQQTLELLPRLVVSIPHHPDDLRRTIQHFEGKDFLAYVASETWDTLYDHGVSLDPNTFVPIMRRCAMLDILDKDWNLLGAWEDILRGIEAKCCPGPVPRIKADSILHEQTNILRNARNSMQCKFFSIRFMKYTEDQAPQRWRYFPKCSAPACSNIETPDSPHRYRCESCWYFHFCSKACEEYCDEIMMLHSKFCKDTPASKASLCREETWRYLGKSAILSCFACGEVGVPSMKRCSQCHKACYCSRQCQQWDWNIGAHKDDCHPAATADISESIQDPEPAWEGTNVTGVPRCTSPG